VSDAAAGSCILLPDISAAEHNMVRGRGHKRTVAEDPIARQGGLDPRNMDQGVPHCRPSNPFQLAGKYYKRHALNLAPGQLIPALPMKGSATACTYLIGPGIKTAGARQDKHPRSKMMARRQRSEVSPTC